MPTSTDCPNIAAFRFPDSGRTICLPHARELVRLTAAIGVPVTMEPIDDDETPACMHPVDLPQEPAQ